jgi:hypothetical protein
MIRRWLAGLLLCLALAALCPAAAYADTGPKPSVRVTFENMDDRLCYGTLLSESESTGPAYAWDGSEESVNIWGEQDREIWQAFVDYKDPDGFYFLQWFWRCDETKALDWGYYPPKTFKILLYYPDTGEFRASGICERYAFDSYFTVDVGTMQSGAAPLPAERSYNYAREVAGFMVRLIITLLIELGVAWLFGFRRKELLLLILGANVVTQVALNLILNGVYNQHGPWAFLFYYVVLEPVIFAAEALFYCLTFRRFGDAGIKRRRIVLYALAANVCSFVGGFLLSKVIPGVF